MPNGRDMPDPPISPEQAEAFAQLFDPLQQATGIGNSIGGVLEDAPYPAVALLGNIMQLGAQSTNTALVAAETLPRALRVYVDAQQRGAEALTPPTPEQVVTDLRESFEGLRELRRQLET